MCHKKLEQARETNVVTETEEFRSYVFPGQVRIKRILTTKFASLLDLKHLLSLSYNLYLF